MVSTAIAEALVAAVDIADGFGWRRVDGDGTRLWFKGYLYGTSAERLAAALTASGGEAKRVLAVLADVRGHFAFACTGPGWAVAAVDRVRSIPLFFADTPGGLRIAAHAPSLLAKLEGAEINAGAALAVAMAGYTIGTDTLYAGLEQLAPGEALLARTAGAPQRLRYHRYRPWLVTETDRPALSRRLAGVTLGIVERMAASADGRTIAIPLSAGLDSRLIASALAHIGYRNVVCFAYGLAGNHEALASRKIADQLGFPWRFFPYSVGAMRRYFASALHRDYLAFADSLSSTPFVQDLPAVLGLRETGFIPADAILVNGNSGDFISGNHIPAPLARPRTDLDAAGRRRLIIEATIGKHFRLWQALATNDNDGRIAVRLAAEMQPFAAAADDPLAAHGAYEALEFADRQCKFVISGERIYEFLGHEWRLPLWADEYLEFWQGVPLSAKAGQRLYREMLCAENWGGVWQGRAWQFPRRVRPAWMRLALRPLCKALFAPFGRARWHRFERRYLQYWMDGLCASAVVPYRRAAADRRGARHAIAWMSESYLAAKGAPLPERFA